MLTVTEQQSLRDFAKRTLDALRQKRANEKVKVSGLAEFDAVEYLRTEEDVAAHLTSVSEERDPVLLAAALADITRARGTFPTAKEVGTAREDLCQPGTQPNLVAHDEGLKK
ncbi:hypothetical protein [Stenotrophomonas bentonitica]|uniref:hypothetical protein n=1 Tax=Stenotrophomonas bentonitica TaxID=1450134 RepID=UPI00345E7017